MDKEKIDEMAFSICNVMNALLDEFVKRIKQFEKSTEIWNQYKQVIRHEDIEYVAEILKHDIAAKIRNEVEK